MKFFKNQIYQFSTLKYTTKSVPGLIYYNNFFCDKTQQSLIQKSEILQKNILDKSLTSKKQKTDNIDHNLAANRDYYNIRVEDIGNKKELSAYYFPNYGDIGHELTYFMNNNNIPNFIKEQIIQKVEKIEPIQQLLNEKAKNENGKKFLLNWKFTLNNYNLQQNTSEQKETPGFDWHKDVEGNGDITMIISLKKQVIFQIRKPGNNSEIFDIQMIPGSLVLMTNESRWDWEHRVKKTENKKSNKQDESRISLVLGCRPTPATI